MHSRPGACCSSTWSNTGGHDELIPLARVRGDLVSDFVERQKPAAGGGIPRVAGLVVRLRVINADQILSCRPNVTA
jgi:hypothetical protein